MIGTRLSLFTVATTLGAAVPAFAQAPAPAPAPMYAPAPAPAPMMAPAPEAAVMPAAPVMAPKAADDMTGSVGFGVGVVGGTDLVKTNDSVMMKYWMSDVMALIPRLDFNINKSKGTDASWGLAPSLLVDFTLLKGFDTRFSAGVGLGFGLAKLQAPAATTSSDTYVDIFVPAQLGVEHFFTRWFAMGIAANFRVIDFAKQGDPWNLKIALNNTSYLGWLFFYTN